MADDLCFIIAVFLFAFIGGVFAGATIAGEDHDND